MNRSITALYRAFARGDSLHPMILLSATFDSGFLRLWNGYGDLTFDGNVYTGAGDLLGITPVSETEEIRANGVNISLSGIPTETVSIALNEPCQGRPIDIKMGFINGDIDQIVEYAVKVSGSKFVVELVSAPALAVTELYTYRFNLSDSSNVGHNLQVSATSDGTHGGGSQYTTGWTEVGTAGSTGAYNQWVVPAGLATSDPTMFYYCENHSGYGSTVAVNEAFIQPDPFVLFDGQMDKMNISDNGENVVISMACESKLISLESNNVRRYTPEDQKIDFSTDLGLDFVSSLQDKDVVWGSG